MTCIIEHDIVAEAKIELTYIYMLNGYKSFAQHTNTYNDTAQPQPPQLAQEVLWIAWFLL